MSDPSGFTEDFRVLTGNLPFPWQEELYRRFLAGEFPLRCNLPTGLGKTAIQAVWLLALATQPEIVPRRLVYVVNRRTVVDQATTEAENLRTRLADLPELRDRLKRLAALDSDVPLAISTLRGQFADNREWAADPARPAIVVGTVDMIGSRLLFSGYRCGFKSKPFHAGLLGQDVLLVHDEAHLEPAFQDLLVAIRDEQEHGQEFAKFRVTELSATSRGAGTQDTFVLTEKERQPPTVVPEPPQEPLHFVWRRLRAKKGLRFHPAQRSDVAKEIGKAALRWKDSEKAVLVFVRAVDDVNAVRTVLTAKDTGVPAEQVQLLTGTLRGLERDRLATKDQVFARFLPQPKVTPQPGTVYLVCTSAGEVGVDISADHLVCDLTPLDSMAQRLGRVNRRGDGQAEVDVVFETDPLPKLADGPLEQARWNTLALLRDELLPCTWDTERRDVCPMALGDLMARLSMEQHAAAFTPQPTILPVSDILFDAWALTTVRDALPGRPPVADWLHGLQPWEPPRTQVAWREEVAVLSGDRFPPRTLQALLEDYPLKPHELLQDRSDRVFKHLGRLAARFPDCPAWLLDEQGVVEVFTLAELADKDEKQRIESRTVLLPPAAGGLDKGSLDGASSSAADVADKWYADSASEQARRRRVWDDTPAPQGMRRIRTVDTKPDAEDADEGSATGKRFWHWYELPTSGDSDALNVGQAAVLWQVHTDDVVCNAERIVARLPLPDEVRHAVVVAARFHDLGKKRMLFQRVLGNRDAAVLLAKSDNRKRSLAPREEYRHEFGSLLDLVGENDFRSLGDEARELVLQLVAAHHGRARPHFPPEEAFDPEQSAEAAAVVAREVPQRFGRLQRRYGRWGLAYLESLLRAADYAASARPSAVVEETR